MPIKFLKNVSCILQQNTQRVPNIQRTPFGLQLFCHDTLEENTGCICTQISFHFIPMQHMQLNIVCEKQPALQCLAQFSKFKGVLTVNRKGG